MPLALVVGALPKPYHFSCLSVLLLPSPHISSVCVDLCGTCVDYYVCVWICVDLCLWTIVDLWIDEFVDLWTDVFLDLCGLVD